MEPLSKIENEINKKIIDNESLEEITDIIFKYLDKRYKSIKKIILEIFKSSNCLESQMIIEKEKNTAARKCNKNSIIKNDFIYKNINFDKLSNLLYINNIKKSNIKECIDIENKNIKSTVIIPFKTKNNYRGLLQIYFKNSNDYPEEELDFLKKLTKVYSKAIDYHLNINKIKKYNNLLQSSRPNILELLISLIEIRDKYTSGHSINVKNISVLIAEQLGIEKHKITKLSNAAVLHDIGKIGISEEIINKPGPLTAEEFEEIKKHSLKGAFLVANIPSLKEVGKIILHHHERYDGGGYPMGLSGNKIPLFSRIIAVADTFDAITSERPYRDELDEKRAIEIIKDESDKQFDPLIVDAFNKIVFRISKKEMPILKKII